MSDRRRYFVLTFGRSGSSLLCAIMADAGADFGMPAPPSWDLRRGVMENPDIKLAAHHMRRAFDIDSGRRYLISPRIETKLRRRRARAFLRKSLGQVRCVKIGDLDLLVQMAFAMGYEPRVILNYREFEGSLASTLVGRKHVAPDLLAADYLRTYRQGLALMHTFGGCTVSYEQMLNPDNTRWLDALAVAADLDRSALTTAAAQRITVPERDLAPPPLVYPECRDVFERMQACTGQAFSPSPQVSRVLSARHPTA